MRAAAAVARANAVNHCPTLPYSAAPPRPSSPMTSVHSRSSRSRSWLTSTSAPGNSARLSSSTSSAGMSRSLVGSSSSSRSAGCSMSWAMRTRACSPPERSPTSISSCSGRNRNCLAQAATCHGRSRNCTVSPLGHSACASVSAGSSVARPCSNITTRRPSACVDSAGIGHDFAGQDTQQRALAAAVGAEQAELHAGREQQIEVREQRPTAERLGDALGGEQLARLPAGCHEVDARGAGGGIAIFQLRQLLAAPGGIVDARLRTCCAGPIPCGQAIPSRGAPGWRPILPAGPALRGRPARLSAKSS